MRNLMKLLKLDKPPTEQGAREIQETIDDFELLYESPHVNEISGRESKRLCKEQNFTIEGSSIKNIDRDKI